MPRTVKVTQHKENVMNLHHTFVRVALLLLAASGIAYGQTAPPLAAPAADQGKDVILKAADISDKLFPATVFFDGQTANVQMEFAGGVRYADGLLVLAATVDGSGYASAVRQKYQAYLILEVPVEIGGQQLKPGAYGFGFRDNNQFVVMDLAANDLLQATSTRDTEIRRPIPMQIIAAEDAGGYRLYHGRDYVEFHRVK
jgi:hypothetical protein